MKNESLYNKTVDILVQAYFNDTLEHGNCYACAVGNIIAGNLDYSFIKLEPFTFPSNIHTGLGRLVWDQDNDIHYNLVWELSEIDAEHCNKHQLWATGYSFEELILIERSFEAAFALYPPRDKDMFNGLMAVIDVLDTIHENNDASTTEQSKNKFNKVCVVS